MIGKNLSLPPTHTFPMLKWRGKEKYTHYGETLQYILGDKFSRAKYYT